MAAPVTFEIPELNLDPLLEHPETLTTRYDQNLDTFFVHVGPQARPGVSLYLNDEIYIRYDPQTGEVIGLQVENWERVFLKHHPQAASQWQATTSRRPRLTLRERLSLVHVGVNPSTVKHWTRAPVE